MDEVQPEIAAERAEHRDVAAGMHVAGVAPFGGLGEAHVEANSPQVLQPPTPLPGRALGRREALAAPATPGEELLRVGDHRAFGHWLDWLSDCAARDPLWREDVDRRSWRNTVQAHLPVAPAVRNAVLKRPRVEVELELARGFAERSQKRVLKRGVRMKRRKLTAAHVIGIKGGHGDRESYPGREKERRYSACQPHRAARQQKCQRGGRTAAEHEYPELG